MEWEQIFVTWGLGWWILSIVWLAGSFALVAWKRGAYFLLSLVVYLGLVQFLGNTPVLAFLETHSLWVLGLAGGFIGLGILWFNWRWHWLTAKMRGRYNEVFQPWCQQKGIEDLPPQDDDSDSALALKAEWEEHFRSHGCDEFGQIEFRPRFRDHKNEILTWMAAWPLDLVVWLVGEVLRDFWISVYYQFQGLLQKIMEYNWRGTEGHMLTPEQRAAWAEAQRRKIGVQARE
jgi:hypothetical protein